MTRDELRTLLEAQLDKVDLGAPFREVYRRLTTPWNKINIGVTIICQGPLRPESARALKHYTKFGPVIYSYWEEDWKDELKYDGVTFLKNKFEETGFNGQNILRQMVSTKNALDLVKTAYCLKVRSDQFLSDISPLIDSIVNHPDRLTTSNVFFRNDTPFHASDLIIGTQTTYLKTSIENVLEILYNNKRGVTGEGLGIQNLGSGLTSEQIITISYLRSKGVHPDLSRWKDQMKRAYNIVDVEQLGKFEINVNSLGKVFKNGDVFPNSISKIEDL
jgi:hypothetical protein